MAHVLVVDDDPPIRETLALVLEDEGHITSQAANGVEALDQLRLSPYPHIVLLDFMMPTLDGLELLERVVQDPALLHNHVYLLMSAAGYLPAARVAAIRQHMRVDILRKPLDIDRLAQQVATAAERLPPRRAQWQRQDLA